MEAQSRLFGATTIEQPPKLEVQASKLKHWLWLVLKYSWHEYFAVNLISFFDFAPGKIIFQAFSLRDKMQTQISPINTNSICDKNNGTPSIARLESCLTFPCRAMLGAPD
jgi:hypothetical protein